MKLPEYLRKFLRTKTVEYGGACDCPKCGKRGYKYYRRQQNLKTGKKSPIYTIVLHMHTGKRKPPELKRKTVFDGSCYLGVGKL